MVVIASFTLAFRSKLSVVPNAPTSWSFDKQDRHEDQTSEPTADSDTVLSIGTTTNVDPNNEMCLPVVVDFCLYIFRLGTTMVDAAGEDAG